MKKTIIIGGKAGQGPNIVTDIIAHGLIAKGYYVFYSREYQSLIRGGHNYNILTFSDALVESNESLADLLVCLSRDTLDIHKNSLKKEALVISAENKGNMFFAGSLYKLLGLSLDNLEKELKKIKNFKTNLEEAKQGYSSEKRSLDLKDFKLNNKNKNFINGSRAIAESARVSGLEFYYAYPMTPATPLMMLLGEMTLEKNSQHKVIEMENEIAVINAALGSSLVGGSSMVGTSGGGFDLMTEALSLSGMAEIPIVVYLAQRPGPSTGLATYNGQNDLNVALYGGHGEFSRIVVSPGDPEQTKKLTNLSFEFSQKFKIPVILLGDKHLAESKYIFNEPKLVTIKKSSNWPKKFNSYEADEKGIATENSEVIITNFKARLEKHKKIEKELEKLETFKVYGNKDGKKLILSWGSTKGSIVDALIESGIQAKFIQALVLEPFSESLKQEIRKYSPENIIVVENNATSPFSQLIAQKTGLIISEKNKILRYDGRPFFSDELAKEFRRFK